MGMRMVPEAPSSLPPYLTTVATQILMCLGLYLSLNLGDPSYNYNQLTTNNRPFYYFITVNGGFRPLLQQTLLLKQMEKVIRSYNAKFVLTIGELGQEDPLLRNGTRNFPSLRIPWYATKVSEENKAGCLSKQIKLPIGRTLEIIVLSTGISQDALLSTRNDHFEGLKRILKATDSNWRFIIGLAPLEGSEENNEPETVKQIHKLLRGMFSRYQVNVYLSGHGCKEYALRGGVAYMSHIGPTSEGSYGSSKEAFDGFLLHKVSLLDIETYHVNLNGKVVRKTVLCQRGHEAM